MDWSKYKAALGGFLIDGLWMAMRAWLAAWILSRFFTGSTTHQLFYLCLGLNYLIESSIRGAIKGYRLKIEGLK